MAALRGFESRFHNPESCVLPNVDDQSHFGHKRTKFIERADSNQLNLIKIMINQNYKDDGFQIRGFLCL